MNAKSSAHHFLLDLNFLVIFGMECKLRSFALRSFIKLPTTSLLVDPNILLRTLFPRRWHDSSIDAATRYGLNDRGVGVRVLVGSRNFNFSVSSRPALGPTQLPIQWLPRVLSSVWRGRGVKLTTYLQLSVEVKKTWVYTSTSHTSSWH
jgi:hypothetical protein